MESDEQLNHDWVKSTLGHGEAMCSRCLITNREAAVLGKLNACDVPRHLPPQRVTAMIKPDQIPDAVADSMREFFHTRGDAQKAIAAALSKWPKMRQRPFWDHMTHVRHSEIILPLEPARDD